MFCGTGSLKHVDEDPSTPLSPAAKGSKKKQGGGSKNPYSTRGLDKFSTVLSELEGRKERIMAKAGLQGVAMVRFMYTNTQDWIPVIIKLREPPKQDAAAPSSSKTKKPPPPALPPPPPPAQSDLPVAGAKEAAGGEPAASERRAAAKGGWRRWRPCYYWPVVMVVILLCLAMFGRAFAICCTSVWWYLVPTMKGGDGRKPMKMTKEKKETGRRAGGDLVLSPSAPPIKRMGGVQELQSPRSNLKR